MAEVTTVSVARIVLSGENVRDSVGDVSELADDIKEHGLIQPLVVVKRDSRFMLVCGHRRLAACRAAGITRVPVVVTDVDDDRLLEVMISENLHSKAMSPIEEAKAFKRMADQGLTQKEIGARIGKSDFYVNQRINALKLPADVQRKVHRGELSLTAALAPRKRVWAPRGRKDSRDVDEKWSVFRIDHMVRWLQGGNLNLNDSSWLRRLFMLKETLDSLLDHRCSHCGQVKESVETCCEAHGRKLRGMCRRMSHEAA